MIYDLIIIGGGPAGITAGIYAARKKLKTLLLTKDFLGQVSKTSQVDNYPGFFGVSGIDLMKKFEEHLKKFKIDIVEGEEVTKIKCLTYPVKHRHFLIETENKKKFQAKSVIVATGRDPRPLEVPGEKEFIGRGVSYCSVCDSPFFKDKKVAVIGGGNAGFEAALDLSKYSKRIFIFEKQKKVIADELLQERVKKDKKIEIHLNKEIKKIEGRGKVQALIYQDLKSDKTFQVPIDGVFIQIGTIPATGFLKGLCEFNAQDEIKVDFQTRATSSPGIFAAGDVVEGKWKQIVMASGEGCRAALAAYEYLQKNSNFY
ncbi:MAG: FAD-dependent oxidoreductase [Patescibacteria group bacterium]|nr:FAD-dependent oxidoreductase [Patescibacteria group bacterium]